MSMRDKDKKALSIDELNNIIGGADSKGKPQYMPIQCQYPGCNLIFDADVSQPYAECPAGHKNKLDG